MRSRATLLLILSGLLAIAPWLQWHRQQAVCMQNQPASTASAYNNLDDLQGGCPDVAPPSPWVHALGILSVASFAGFLFFLVQGIVERCRDQALLRGAGIYVPESDSPLDE